MVYASAIRLNTGASLEIHRVAAGTIVACDTDEGIEVAEAAKWITWRGVQHVALLPRVEKGDAPCRP